MDNLILDKSKSLAIRCVNLYRYLCEEKREFVLSKQLLKSATSIGANCREASRAQSTADFISKLNIALKEADETAYCLELLHETDYINDNQFKSIYSDVDELIKILVKILKTTKNF
ncbi:MAG: four helix bundle protein [Clostridia bacterium]|nr:four helix bundle protein [Clostridia bacterium]